MSKLEITIEDSGDDYCPSCLKVFHNGEIIAEKYDGGEPEDRYFCRDWSWVPELLEKVYQLGLEDGRKQE